MSNTKFRPMPGKVVVEIAEVGERTYGNLILPAPARDAPTLGKVIAVPEDAVVDGQEITAFVQVGDWVVFGKYAGNEIKVTNDRRKKYVVMREIDILAIVEEVPEVLEPIPAGDVDDVVGPEPDLESRGEIIDT